MRSPAQEIREAIPDDEAFIYASWIGGMRAHEPFRRLDKNWFCAAQHALVEALRRRSRTLCATAPGQPHEILGYIVGEPRVRLCHWLHVKDRPVSFRGLGIEGVLLTAMFGDDGPAAITAPVPLVGLRDPIRDTHGLCEVPE